MIGSIKSNVGHLEAAAGMAGLIKTALCSAAPQIPGNLHFENPNPQIPFDDLRLRVAQRLEPWPETHGQPARAGVNSFGFGGTNGHAILEAAPEPAHADAASGGGARRSCLDAAAVGAQRGRAARSGALLSRRRSRRADLGDEALRDICFSAGVKRSHHEFRLALVAHDHAELVEQLEAFRAGEERANSSTGRIQQCRRSPSSSARAWASSGGRWGASCSPKSRSFAGRSRR